MGDAVISCAIARSLRNRTHIIISSKKNEDLVRKLTPSNCSIIVLPNITGIFPIYDLKNLRINFFEKIWTMLYFFFFLRSIVYKSKHTLIVDQDQLRNKFFYVGIKKVMLSTRASIYDSFELQLGVPLLNKNLLKQKDIYSKTALIFPFGSIANRRMNSSTIQNLCNMLQARSIKHKILLYDKEVDLLDREIELPFEIYNNFDDLIKYIHNAGIVFTVDTLHLHLGLFFSKEVFVFSDSNKDFIPTILFQKKLVFSLNPTHKEINLIKDTI